MKKIIAVLMLIILTFMMCACKNEDKNKTDEKSKPTTETKENQVVETTAPITEEPTKPEHSEFYIEGIDVDDIITYFNEVCLDAEVVYSGDASLLQKWTVPISYTIEGNYTNEDLRVLDSFVSFLNTIEGFPGISQASNQINANLDIHFCDEQTMYDIMGDDMTGLDGRVTFWYDNNAIYDATICYRNDIEQYTRNSVILEEIYNGLGPLQDTSIRTDSIIYSEFTTPQELTEIDELILKLLYHPDMKCGMNKEECEEIIRKLYY